MTNVFANGAEAPIENDAVLDMARASVYRMLATAFSDPKMNTLDELKRWSQSDLLDESIDVIREMPVAHVPSLTPLEEAFDKLNPQYLWELLPVSNRKFDLAHEAAFGLLASGNCPPYESEYIDGKLTFQRSNSVADVSGFYRAFGLQPQSRHPKRQDHISIELEFMAFLMSKQAEASSSGAENSIEQATVCREAQMRFFVEHLAWWAPALGAILSRNLETNFFGRLGQFLSAWIAVERGLLGVSAPKRVAQPDNGEPMDLCSGCGIQ